MIRIDTERTMQTKGGGRTIHRRADNDVLQ